MPLVGHLRESSAPAQSRIHSWRQEGGPNMRTMQLLQTKLQRPRVPRHHVPRPRLFERLDQGSQAPLILVCANAGYGKTTLVSSWIESLAAGNASTTPEPAAWISLDERDSDLGLFLRYFTAALRTMFPDACAETISLLQATRQPPFDLLCATLINEIAALPQDFVLVLDDYHLITGAAVPDLFGEFERHWPQPMHLVLLSRYRPALSLASLRAKGHLTEIRARDLRFTRDEAAGYLEQALQKPLSPPAIELLERRTEGWIAGLQLAGLSLRDAEDPEDLLAGLSGLDCRIRRLPGGRGTIAPAGGGRLVFAANCDPGSFLRLAVRSRDLERRGVERTQVYRVGRTAQPVYQFPGQP